MPGASNSTFGAADSSGSSRSPDESAESSRSPDSPPASPTDAELFQRIGKGDRAAFESLVDRHARYLFGIALSLSRNSADAEDLVQDSLVAILNAAGKFRGESSVRTYMVSILVRQAGMLRRKSVRRSEESAAVDQTHASVSNTSGVDARLDLNVMLQVLSLEHRQVVVLRELEGLSYEEIAAALGVPRGTVESRLHRARGMIRERFKDYF